MKRLIALMLPWTKTLTVTLLLAAAACGGTDYSHPPATYSLAGHWQIWTGSTPADAAIVGQMDLAADVSSGTYTEAGTPHALTAHTFAPASPDFALTFGDHVVAGKLLAESNSYVFKGTLGTQPVTGVFVP